ncbi:hypothetical protein [Natrinema altunense]|uniref:Uncharacterized protein n=1 Tax=Natrinema altunense TaxID=222984 RepID=A0A482Y4V4_9EURY|nr:hypothetical protein [Natrinema altunense]RZH68826.1 hypothetical protein ELS17_05040 [Natrinema altunense]
MRDYPRRRLLAATGTALTGAVAGCTGSDGNGDGNGEENGNSDRDAAASDPDSGADGTLLGTISLENLDDETHTIDAIVEFGDGPEHWSTHELTGDSGVELERNWPSDPGDFRVMFRLDGGEPTQVTPAELGDSSCVNVFALVDRNGELKILSDTDGGPCGDGDAAVDDATE